jgi:glycine/D-amino acid oxidase-like deaminating enzyme/nitrite reductase/ring-hydroxylating ferredoxin subunit
MTITSGTPWESKRMPKYPRLKKARHFDVVVIGAGITGLSAAYFLKEAGKNVCVLERSHVGSGDTARTTAHLTYVTDLRLSKIVKTFGETEARTVWQGGATAIDAIDSIAGSRDIRCEFRRVPAFLHAPLHGNKCEGKQLKNEAELASKLGFDARFVEAAPLVDRPGILFSNQAKFHPMAYLAGLAKAVHGGGSVISEDTEVKEIEEKPLRVKSDGLEITCDYLVIATHVPMMGITGLVSATLFQTKLYPYSTYAIGATIPRGRLAEMSLWDTSDPYYYLRIDRGTKNDYAIFGGGDHKTGQIADTDAPFDDLTRTLKELLPEADIDRRWSGQVIETNDGLPLIGETAENQFVATGFAGNGITFGTLAGMMARDAVLKRENPWQKLFAVNRRKIRGGTLQYLKENIDYPYYYLKDHLTPAESSSTRDVKRGTGQVIKHDGQRVACSRDSSGKLTAVSAVCTHMGCLVRWNNAEQTWDCPCHGSRFKPDGAVIAGPAETPLEPVRLVAKEKSKAAASKNGKNANGKKARAAAGH